VAGKRQGRGPAWGKIAAIAVAVALLAAAWRWTPLAEIATAENILAWSRTVRSTWWAPFVLVAAYVVGAFVLFPRPVITLVSVLTFGVWLGVAYGMAGVLVAALVTYAAGRLLPEATVRRIAGDALESVGKKLREHGIVAIFAANMLPTPPFAVQNMIAGAVRIRLWQFMLGTFLALLPAVLAWTVFGDQISAALEDSSKVSYWAIGAVVVLFAAFLYLTRRWLRAKGF
jgi:phospholipase D1/2